MSKRKLAPTFDLLPFRTSSSTRPPATRTTCCYRTHCASHRTSCPASTRRGHHGGRSAPPNRSEGRGQRSPVVVLTPGGYVVVVFQNRQLLRDVLMVELVEGNRKLRHVFLFSDVLLCTKLKKHMG